MKSLKVAGKRVQLELLDTCFLTHKTGHQSIEVRNDGKTSARASALATEAANTFFNMPSAKTAGRAKSMRRGAPPAIFRERGSGLHRVAYREAVLRFSCDCSERMRRRILRKHGFKIREQNPYIPEQYVVYQPVRKYAGVEILGAVTDWGEMEEVLFASPNFVSEYGRDAPFPIPDAQWYLKNVGRGGQKKGEDVRIEGAWAVTRGKESIAVAVLDDGVDLDHPSFQGRILERPDPDEPRDIYGRDFFLEESHPAHFDPRPKVFNFEFSKMKLNDIHGTACAGLIAATGDDGGILGLAPGCKILPVKVFHAAQLAADARVANAIRYASRFARVLSCSWHGPMNNDVQLAMEMDAALAHGGKGAAIFCAVGNWKRKVNFPAHLSSTIAVGASTDQGELAPYSTKGPEVNLVAPSGGGIEDIRTTDVATPRPYYGFNPGGGDDPEAYYYGSFTGTSAATPIASAVGALVLSANEDLDRDAVSNILTETADKIGDGYNENGHSEEFGYGRINAAAAVEAALALKRG